MVGRRKKRNDERKKRKENKRKELIEKQQKGIDYRNERDRE